MKTLRVKGGSIILWKNYNIFERLWSRITRKQLKYNNCILFPTNMDIVGPKRLSKFTVLEPIKPYTKKELFKLRTLVSPFGETNLQDIKLIINNIRPNTFQGTETFTGVANNTYYKQCVIRK